MAKPQGAVKSEAAQAAAPAQEKQAVSPRQIVEAGRLARDETQRARGKTLVERVCRAGAAG